MKKKMILFAVTVLAVALAAGLIGNLLIRRAESAGERRVENMIGAVAEEYPGAENAFVRGMADEEFRWEEEGSDILSSYGYDSGESVPEYRRFLYVFAVLTAALAAAALLFGYSVMLYAKKRQDRQKRALLTVMEDCLSEDFRFAGKDLMPDGPDDSQFADTLMKLAQTLELKTKKFNEERDNTKTLVTDISHQLKTPISAMKVCFDLYLEAETEEERQEFIQRTKLQMDKLESLAASLVNISRLENSMITLNPEKTDLTDILVGAVNTVYHKASGKNTEIVTEDFEDVEVNVDRKWTVEALANILDNGIKYSPAGSMISIRVNKLFSFVRIEIQDQGIGIPKEERNKIFTRFYRGTDEAVKGQEGSGVGLYLTRRILEDQGGTVSVRPAAGGGSIFAVQLPLG